MVVGRPSAYSKSRFKVTAWRAKREKSKNGGIGICPNGLVRAFDQAEDVGLGREGRDRSLLGGGDGSARVRKLIQDLPQSSFVLQVDEIDTLSNRSDDY